MKFTIITNNRSNSPDITAVSLTHHNFKPHNYSYVLYTQTVNLQLVHQVNLSHNHSLPYLVSLIVPMHKHVNAQLLDQLLRETFLQRRKDIGSLQQPTRELFMQDVSIFCI